MVLVVVVVVVESEFGVELELDAIDNVILAMS